jgi:rhomboid protease GluP
LNYNVSQQEYSQQEYIRIDKRPPYITYILLTINIVLWLLMTVAGGSTNIYVLQSFGAKVNVLIASGQYWRLITPMFLHIGIAHLFFNSYALYIYGTLTERLFGKSKFIIIYLISGLFGTVFSYLFSPPISAGASGAIFGLFGALLYFRKARRGIFNKLFGVNLIIIIGFNLVYGFTSSGIDNWGHIGGLVGGFLVSSWLGLYSERSFTLKRVMYLLLAVLILTVGIKWGDYKYRQEALINKALNSYSTGNIQRAVEDIQELLADNPDNIEGRYILGAIYAETGHIDEAINQLNILLDKDGGHIPTHLLLSKIYISTGQLDSAKDHLKTILAMDPDLAEAQTLLDSIQ